VEGWTGEGAGVALLVSMGRAEVMDYELVRTLLHHLLRQMLKRAGSDPGSQSQFNQDMQLASLVRQLGQLARQEGHISNSGTLSRVEQDYVSQALWELIIQGVLMPISGGGSGGWPSVSFTEYGKQVIAEEDYSPYDPSGYLTQLKSDIGELDSVLLFYLEEALGTFRANRYTASTVMLGVASERLFDMLLDSFLGALASEPQRNQLQQRTQGRMLLRRYDELKKRFDSKMSQLPLELRENLDTSLVSIFNIVRYARNDSGHPTGNATSRDEAYANLYVFGRYCVYMCQLISHLQNHPNSLT